MDLKLFYMGAIGDMTPENINDAQAFVSTCTYAAVATNNKETGARLSYMNRMDGKVLGEYLFATEVTSQKALNLKENPHCEIGFTNGENQIFFAGTAEVLTDLESKKAIWQDFMINYFTDGVEGESWCVVRFSAAEVRAMIM